MKKPTANNAQYSDGSCLGKINKQIINCEEYWESGWKKERKKKLLVCSKDI